MGNCTLWSCTKTCMHYKCTESYDTVSGVAEMGLSDFPTLTINSHFVVGIH